MPQSKSTFLTNWLGMRPTPRRSKKLRRELLLRLKDFKRKREKPVLKLSQLLRLHLSALPDLAVLLVLFLQLLVIFALKVDTPIIHSELPTCALDAASEATGPICVIPEINLCRQDPNLDCFELCEF